MKQNELIFQQQRSWLCMSAAQTVKHAAATLEAAAGSASFWEVMAVMQAAVWRLEISVKPPSQLRRAALRQSQDGSVDREGGGGRQLRRR